MRTSKKGDVHKPTVSVVIPTPATQSGHYKTAWNSHEISDFVRPLKSSISDDIKNQDYQGEVEIIIADSGSTDNTLEIARKYTNKIYQNPLKTGEVGKAM